MKTFLSAVLLVALVAGGGYYYLKFYRTAGTSSFRIDQVQKGEMMPTIGATGTIEPEQVVDIGSQVNGLITDLKVDYGSVVDKDTVLATIDETLYQAAVDQNQALLDRAKADVGQMQANLELAQSNLKRDDALLKKGAIAQADYDTASAAVKVAQANVGVDMAAIKQADATLKQAMINLGYCKITSPVKGVIVDRRVNVGQTVVSNLSASSLFLLAKDLSKIQVWASVNEADIGRIVPGVPVSFTVDAYPNETFKGEVAQVRLNATMTQNVVTYTVVVTTDNKEVATPKDKSTNGGEAINTGPRYKLLPYMTANLLFEIERHEDVLKVPNAALRWKPRPQQIAPDVREETLKAMAGGGGKSKKNGDAKSAAAKDSAEDATTADSDPSATDSTQPAAGGDAKDSAQLASSAGSATGVTPDDWKARTAANAATNGKPADSAAAPKAAKAAGGGDQAPGRALSPQELKAKKVKYESSRLWVVDGNFVKPIPVKIIATDGTMTEVRGKGVSEGMEIVTGENVATEADSSDTTNPFMPRLGRPNSANAKSTGTSK